MKHLHFNALIDAIAFAGFMALAVSGLVLRIQLPPGSGGVVGRGLGRGAAHQPIELLWGLTRHDWGDYHYWIAVGLLAVLSVHLLLHWKWIICVVRGTRSEASGARLAVGLFSFVAVLLVGVWPLVSDTTTTTRDRLQQQRLAPNVDTLGHNWPKNCVVTTA